MSYGAAVRLRPRFVRADAAFHAELGGRGQSGEQIEQPLAVAGAKVREVGVVVLDVDAQLGAQVVRAVALKRARTRSPGRSNGASLRTVAM